jgi:hypothetical protein
MMVWGCSIAFAVGLSVGFLVWNQSQSMPPLPHTSSPQIVRSESAVAGASGRVGPEAPDTNPNTEPSESTPSPLNSGIEQPVPRTELASWSQTSVFEELSQLNDAQAEKLGRLLDAANQGAPVR